MLDDPQRRTNTYANTCFIMSVKIFNSLSTIAKDISIHTFKKTFIHWLALMNSLRTAIILFSKCIYI